MALVEALTAWASFYVITGSSAGALIGLTFVVISLVREARDPNGDALAAFTTPTIVHFCEVLLVAAVLSAPWPALAPAGLTLALCGLVGLSYTLIVVRRVRRVFRQRTYEPVLEDWLTHVALPLLAYLALTVAALLLPGYSVTALFLIGAVMLLLLFVGIHNAWDTVVFVAVVRNQQHDDPHDDPKQ